MSATDKTGRNLGVGSPVPHERGASGFWRQLSRKRRRRLAGGLVFALVLTALFIRPLAELFTYASSTELHSHILLVPFISAYLVFLERRDLPWADGGISVLAPVVFAAGLAALGLAVVGDGWSRNDHLALLTLSYLCFLCTGGFVFLGSRWMAGAAFPIAFLGFMIPLPDRLVEVMETASTLASAEAANAFFEITRTPVFREGPVFHIPGIVIEVARECSGIRSSWVLLITSVLASFLFLRSPWRRAVLVAAAIPLGILRNGFRIYVIGVLCIRDGPQMIHSAVHRQGGPGFFVLSLVPLVLLLWLLRRKDAGGTERRSGAG